MAKTECRLRLVTQRTHSIHPYIAPWARRPQVSSVLSLPHWVSFQAIGTGFGVLGFRPYWCPSDFPFAFSYLCVFPFTLLHLPLNFIRVSSLRLMYLHQPFTYSLFLGEFPVLGLDLVPD